MAGPLEVLARLSKAYGELDWWPVDKAYHAAQGSDPRFEIVVGAILTQNTAWTNVEMALANLRSRKLFNPKAMAKADVKVLREAIRPAGFFNQKADYLLGVASYLHTTYPAGLDAFFRLPVDKLRRLLLSFNGIGEETADDILVYAAQKPVFIVDAYARRISKRLGLAAGDEPYDRLASLWGKRLPRDAATFARAHALLVEHAKRRCTLKTPVCPGCPLEAICLRVGVEDTVYLRAAESQARAGLSR